MSPAQKRVGLIGLSAKGSWASRSHLGYLQNNNLYKISALQNSSKASAEAAAKQYKIDNVTTHDNPLSIACDPNVDIVAVSVNVPQHYSLIRPALEAGKDVFCEWPLARDLSEAEELVQLAKRKGVRTLVGLQARQSPTIVKAKEIVASGKLGRILSTTMYGHGAMMDGTVPEGFLYVLPVEAGANVVTIPFGHAIDAFCFVLGEIKDISASVLNLRPESEVIDAEGKSKGKIQKTAPDHLSIIGRLANDGGVMNATYCGGDSRTGRNFHWEINGTDGSLVIENPNMMGGHIQMFQPTMKLATDAGMEEVSLEKATDFSFNVGKAWDAWAGVGLDQGYSATTFDEALVRHKMIDAIFRSAERGTTENYL